jgi:hypothetical protein
MAPRPVPDRREASAAAAARRPWWLVGLAAAAAAVFAVATLPAALLAGRLERAGLSAISLSGSVWGGTAQGLVWRGVSLGDLHWSIEPLALATLRVAGDLRLDRSDGRLASRFSLARNGILRLAGAEIDLPVEALSALPIGMPRAWRGRVSGRFDEIALSRGWPTALAGTIDMDGLVAPPPRNISIGSYRVVIPDPKAAEATDGRLTARVADKEGPFSFDGQFSLGSDRSFLLEGTLAPRGTTPPELVRSLQLRRPVSVSGTL